MEVDSISGNFRDIYLNNTILRTFSASKQEVIIGKVFGLSGFQKRLTELQLHVKPTAVASSLIFINSFRDICNFQILYRSFLYPLSHMILNDLCLQFYGSCYFSFASLIFEKASQL